MTTITVTQASLAISPNPIRSGEQLVVNASGTNFPEGTVGFAAKTFADGECTTDDYGTGLASTSATAGTVGDGGTFTTQLVIQSQTIGQQFCIVATETNSNDSTSGTNATAASAIVTARPAPLAPVTGLTLTPGPNMLTATWVANQNAEKYDVRWRKATETDWSSPVDANTNFYDITGLTGGTAYWVQVKPNKAGYTESTYTAARGTPDVAATTTTKGVTLSSMAAGATVSISINADAMAAIAGGEDVVVELPKFGLPSSIDASEVLIDSAGYNGMPSDVSVSGSKITVGVPARDDDGPTSIPAGDYTIKVKQTAGITNPAAAGSQTIKVTDNDAKAEEYDVTINRVISLSAAKGPRGTMTTATLKGFANGTATVMLNKEKLAEVTVEDNVGTLEIDTTPSKFMAGDNSITATDSAGMMQYEAATFTITPKVALDPDSTSIAKTVKVTLSDWPANRDLKAVTIGSVDVTPDTDSETRGVQPPSTDAKGGAKFDISVPPTVNRGAQTLKVTGAKDAAMGTATLTIGVLSLDIMPSGVVPGQQVTITGSGFGNDQKVESLTIGGKDWDYKPATEAHDTVPNTSTSSGNFAITMTVPDDVGSGDKEGQTGSSQKRTPRVMR